jgi:hypothetical protein
MPLPRPRHQHPERRLTPGRWAHGLDLGVRDAKLLRQGVELDHRAQRILARAHRSGLVSPQPDAEVTPGPRAGPHLVGEQLTAAMAEIHASGDAVDGTIDRAVEGEAASAAEIGEATARERAIHEFQAEPSLEPSWQQGKADRPPAADHELQQRSRAGRTAITEQYLQEHGGEPDRNRQDQRFG